MEANMIEENWKDVIVYSVRLMLVNKKMVSRNFIFEATIQRSQIENEILTKLPNIEVIQSIEELQDAWKVRNLG
ncbi:hypothetical protein [Vagococcus salmoninarum]|uniref:hypothetical protein n=2 Tax=Vagococcus salmoninarum TaxID=2739 RepID=UPI003A4C7BF9